MKGSDQNYFEPVPFPPEVIKINPLVKGIAGFFHNEHSPILLCDQGMIPLEQTFGLHIQLTGSYHTLNCLTFVSKRLGLDWLQHAYLGQPPGRLLKKLE